MVALGFPCHIRGIPISHSCGVTSVCGVLLGRDAELQVLDDLVLQAPRGTAASLWCKANRAVGRQACWISSSRHSPKMSPCSAAWGWRAKPIWRMPGWPVCFVLCSSSCRRYPRCNGPRSASALALEGADQGGGGDQLAVAAGGLALLAAAANETPTVVVIDDLQWLEPSSRFAVLFAARRITNDRLGIVLAARPGPSIDALLKGLSHIALGGLHLDEATQLMSTLNADISVATVEALVEATGGNPLALMEAARGLDRWQIAGVRPLGASVTVGDHLETAFAVDLEKLSPEGRLAVALAAAEPSGERFLLQSAAADLGVGLSGFREAAEAGLLEETISTITVRHPLLRSVALRRTERRDLRRMHHTLATHLDEGEIERRAWHFAAASDAPDEFVAALVESVAHAALARSDVAAAVAGFEQAAMLSPRKSDRGRRLFNAGAAASHSVRGTSCCVKRWRKPTTRLVAVTLSCSGRGVLLRGAIPAWLHNSSEVRVMRWRSRTVWRARCSFLSVGLRRGPRETSNRCARWPIDRWRSLGKMTICQVQRSFHRRWRFSRRWSKVDLIWG